MCKAALPQRLSACEATIILLFNIFLPGVGTMLASIMGRACHCDTFLVGVLQLVTAPLLVGWVWSIWWGVAACGRVGKPEKDHRKHRPASRSRSASRRSSRERQSRPAPAQTHRHPQQYEHPPQQGFPQAYPDPTFPQPVYTQPYPTDYPPTKPPV